MKGSGLSQEQGTPPFILQRAGFLNRGRRHAGRQEYTYDPRHPVPTRGGAVCCNHKVFPWGPMDQRGVETREDVLVYSSEPLKKISKSQEKFGRFCTSDLSARYRFHCKARDVYPDGQTRNLCDGILRLRYRTSLRKPELAKPGEIYTITIPAGVTSNVFKSGHRIRLEVSSSNFPRFDRNPNTGRPIADETEMRAAHQVIYYGGRRASHLLLPVIP